MGAVGMPKQEGEVLVEQLVWPIPHMHTHATTEH